MHSQPESKSPNSEARPSNLTQSPTEFSQTSEQDVNIRTHEIEHQLDSRLPIAMRQNRVLRMQQVRGNHYTTQLLTSLQREPSEADLKQQQYDNAAVSPLSTIDDLILLVQHVETAYPGDDWKGITTRIRKSYYDGFLWNSMINDREKYAGLAWPPLTVQDYKAITTAKNHPEITVNGDSIDFGHVLTGLDAMNFPKTGTIMGVAGVEGPPGATWAGDVGSALAQWDLSSFFKDRTKREEFYKQYASNDDMLGDVDGIAISAAGPATATAGISDTLSSRLRAFYKSSSGGASGSSKRFTKFAQGSGFQFSGSGAAIRLDAAAKQRIRSQINNFGLAWRRKGGGQTGANWFHDEDLDWFTTRFVSWVEQGLAAENP